MRPKHQKGEEGDDRKKKKMVTPEMDFQFKMDFRFWFYYPLCGFFTITKVISESLTYCFFPFIIVRDLVHLIDLILFASSAFVKRNNREWIENKRIDRRTAKQSKANALYVRIYLSVCIYIVCLKRLIETVAHHFPLYIFVANE